MMKFPGGLRRIVQFNVFLIASFSMLLAACGGGGGITPPVIAAMVFSFASGVAPASMPTAVVGVTDAFGSSITNATVSVNGVALTYNSAPGHLQYEGMVTVDPGAPTTLKVTVGGNTYTSTGTQATSAPVISSPVSGDTWLKGSDTNMVSWSGGAPLANAAYVLAVTDAADPAGSVGYVRAFPADPSTFNVALPPSALPVGKGYVMLGIATDSRIANADPSSALIVGVYAYAPITVTPTPIPSNVQAWSSGDGQNTVSWAAVPGSTSYNLYWSTTAANANPAFGTKIANVASPYVHTGLTNGATFYYTVTAVSSAGESVVSQVMSATPGAPDNVIATAGNAQATISWPAMTGATSYNIYWSTTAANANKVSGTKIANVASPYVQTGLTNGTTFYYSVTGNYAAGEGPESSWVKATTGTSFLGGVIQGYPLVLANTATVIGGTPMSGGPHAMTTDGNNIYWVDATNIVWKQALSSGTQSIIAGSGGIGSAADGIGAAASFWGPAGITTDGTNLYVTDNNTIRKVVIATGAVTTLAGSAFVVGAADGTGTAASFAIPYGITTDGTNLYVTDAFNNNIRKIVISTGQVTTFASGFTSPRGITMDRTNLYVADSLDRTIKQVALANGAVTALAGSTGVYGSTDGAGTSALFGYPLGITTDGTNLYVADLGTNFLVRKIVISTAAVTTPCFFGGTGAGITTDGLNLFLSGSYSILKVQ